MMTQMKSENSSDAVSFDSSNSSASSSVVGSINNSKSQTAPATNKNGPNQNGRKRSGDPVKCEYFFRNFSRY